MSSFSGPKLNIGVGQVPMEDVDTLGLPPGAEMYMSDDLYDDPMMWSDPEGEVPEIEVPTFGWGEDTPEPVSVRDYVEAGGMSNDTANASMGGATGMPQSSSMGMQPAMGAPGMAGMGQGGQGSAPPAADALTQYAQERDAKAKQFQQKAAGLGAKYGL